MPREAFETMLMSFGEGKPLLVRRAGLTEDLLANPMTMDSIPCTVDITPESSMVEPHFHCYYRCCREIQKSLMMFVRNL